MQGVQAKISSLFFPPRCVLCQRPGADGLDICEQCYRALPFIRTACTQCALPLAGSAGAGDRCGQCMQKPPAFDHAVSLMRYEGSAVQLVTRFKFHDKLHYSRLLAELLFARLRTVTMPEGIIAVPLHTARLRQRGFNQSHELAKLLSAKLGVPELGDCVVRSRATQQQTGLNAAQRKKNIRGAFTLARSPGCKSVALVDDVVTTGSTVNEIARLLKRAGVERVAVWCIARAV